MPAKAKREPISEAPMIRIRESLLEEVDREAVRESSTFPPSRTKMVEHLLREALAARRSPKRGG